MLTYYTAKDNILRLISEKEIQSGIEPIWIEIADPTLEEEQLIASSLNLNVSTSNEITTIKLPSCHYRDKGEVYATINILTDTHELQTVSIILTANKIITIRSAQVNLDNDYLNYIALNNSDPLTPARIFAHLIEAKTNYIDEHLKEITFSLDQISQTIFYSDKYASEKEKKIVRNLETNIKNIGQNGHLISKNHESLISINLALNFIIKSKAFKLSPVELESIHHLINYVASAENQISFLTTKIDFLLNVCLGMIDIEQSIINKVVSIAALVFLPPAIIAGIFGMNFEYMPELKSHYGYPCALLAMLLSGTLPYFFCKFKKWL